MNALMKKIAAGAAAAALALGLVACGGSQAPAGNASTGDAAQASYKIATDTTFAPFEYADASGQYVGIDVELLAAIAEDQHFSYQLEPLGFDAALQSVQSGQSDGVIAGMSITEERKGVFDFSDPYYDSTVCCAVKADGDVKSLDDLKGKNVAVKNGTMSADWAASLADQYGFTTTTFDTSDVMYQDVEAGNSAACFEDTPVMGYAISTGNVKLQIVSEADASGAFATPYGFAVKKGTNPELLQKFNAGLKNIKDSGKYDEIVNKYVSRS